MSSRVPARRRGPTIQGRAEGQQISNEPAGAERPGPRRWPRLAAGAAAGALLWCAFPPVDWPPVAFVALVPLFALAAVRNAGRSIYLAAYLGGWLFWALAVAWLRLIGPEAWVGWIVLGTVFGLWWPLFLFLARWAHFRLRVPLIVAAPIAWVAVEHLLAFFLTGFPWYYLAHSQYRWLHFIQISDVTGALGVSLIVAAVNAWLAELAMNGPLRDCLENLGEGPVPSPRLSRRSLNVRWISIALLIGGDLGYGAYRIASARFRAGPRIALLQSNLRQGRKFDRDPNKVLDNFRQMIARAVNEGANKTPADGAARRPDLIIWPETSYPFGFIMTEPGIGPSELKRQVESITAKMTVEDWLEKRDLIRNDLQATTNDAGVPMLVGARVYDHRRDGLRNYNSALLFEPGSNEVSYYHKMHLVPFGEFIPLIDSLPWMAWLAPYREVVPHLDFGAGPRVFAPGPYRFAPAICFEDTISRVIERFFEGRGQARQPDVLVNLSNDGWYPNSTELDVHLAIGVFRTIEHRVPLVRAVNTGLSALVDGNGAVRAVLPKDVEDLLVVDVPLDDRTTYYSLWGDWFGLTCLAVSIGWLPMGLVGRARLKPTDGKRSI